MFVLCVHVCGVNLDYGSHLSSHVCITIRVPYHIRIFIVVPSGGKMSEWSLVTETFAH